MTETDADADAAPPEGTGDQASLSDLVKDIVKEMDGDELFSKPDVYDESTEVRRNCCRLCFKPVGTAGQVDLARGESAPGAHGCHR